MLQSSKLSTPAREGERVFIGQALVMDYYGHSHKDAKASATESPQEEQLLGMNWDEKE